MGMDGYIRKSIAYCIVDRKEKCGRNGTVYVALKKVWASIMGFEPISNRITRQWIKRHFYKTTTITV
jgi:hypothetical protein